MSLYSEYLKERTHDEILEVPEGFTVYRYLEKDLTVFICDMYVSREYRYLGIATKMADSICIEAREKGMTKFIAGICPLAKNSTESLKVLLAYGMSLKSSGDNLILLEKDL